MKSSLALLIRSYETSASVSPIPQADMIKAAISATSSPGIGSISVNAINGGVKKAHIIDGRIQHSLLLEIYTEEGVGTH